MKKYLFFAVITIAIWSCNRSNKMESADTTEALKESSADTVASDKIIKTADMRFRVKDVQTVKEKLSNSVKEEGGMIVEFTVQSNIMRTEKAKYSADSLLELTSYRKEGQVVAKVPSDKLDDFTNKVVKMAVFVDQQSLKLDDQSMNYLSNALKNRNRVEAVQQLNKHANKKSNNVETALEIKDDYVDKKIQNQTIDSRVKYSTITLNFYQDNTVQRLVVGNDDLYDYRPAFMNRFWLGIQNGWLIFKEFILILTNLWVLILLAGAGYFVFRHYRRKKKLMSA
ncbi:DUF4349 domain-containing protein [Pedobacter sp.]|jgi:hypothetical protein|uniref:DUF4349 domain-containing protein n=1 Tax=Pedobacter sp. TaxID=1411316 RepID=UPI002C8FABC3|nr:DUF4349 domain-containing protein [Pedobacter sp.]HWW41060.1 DUF4349 domain-containing protein [Pedobacter sp.]